MRRRPRLAKSLVAVGAVLLLLGGVGLYLNRAVFNSGSFARPGDEHAAGR